jgi:hypothetical protein
VIGAPLAGVLRSGRDVFNARFVAARRQNPALDGESLQEFLRASVDPLAEAVHAVRPDRVAEVVMAAFEVGLELLGQRLVGPGARWPVLEDGWRELVPAAPLVVAAEPARVLAAVCNALHNLAATPGARPSWWISEMRRLAPRCANADELLAVGQICAWRAGLAHFRAGALAVGDTLPAPLAAEAAGAPGAAWAELRAALSRDPWLVPGAASGPRTIRVGAFEGFGGLFLAPPRAVARDANLYVLSGGGAWLLTADAFGATFHRAAADECGPPSVALPAGVELFGGAVMAGATRVSLDGELTSAAATATTLALTSALSHAVVLVARP